MSQTTLASLTGVQKKFGALAALDGFDLTVQRGELLALLGPNGAGKSTAISILLGLQNTDRGEARLFGLDPSDIEGRRRIGVMMQDLDIGSAMAKYSILTIGEGMVAQIPALLGAMAAGLIVTRTSDEDDKHLGDSIRKQLSAKPRVLIVAGGICLLMALVPGFPSLVFVMLGPSF